MEDVSYPEPDACSVTEACPYFTVKGAMERKTQLTWVGGAGLGASPARAVWPSPEVTGQSGCITPTAQAPGSLNWTGLQRIFLRVKKVSL